MGDESTPAPGTDDGQTAGSASGDPSTSADGGVAAGRTRPFGLPRWVVALLPVVLLALVAGGFLVAAPFADLGGEPLPDLAITQTDLPDRETMVVHVTNDGSRATTVSQVLVDEAYWSHRVLQDGAVNPTIQPGESARVVIPYHWSEAFDYEIALVTPGGATFHHTVVAAQGTPGLSTDLLLAMALVGLFVGVVPVALGMAWFPFIRTMRDRWLHAILAFSAGVLGFLAVDTGVEALETAEAVPGFFEGTALVVLVALATLLLVQAVSAWASDRGGEARDGLRVAYLVALGIGLHNLAEGLAIGSSFALGRASLGAFLIVGFMVHNLTEGPAVVAPAARGERPALAHFVALGALAGAPVILGGWVGSLAYSPLFGAAFLAAGVGAILQVLWELSGMVRRDAGRVGSATNLVAFVVGLVVMYATDLLVTL